MPTFSYAQAAKGVSDAPVPTKSVSTEPETTDSKPQEQTNDVVAESAPTNSEPETIQETEKAAPTVDQDAEFTTVTSKTKSKAAHSRTSSPSVKSTTTQPKEGDSSNTTNGTQESSSEKQNQTDVKAEKTDKAENSTEGPKEKSGKSEKAEKAEKTEKNTPPKELKAAPLPSVNIWQQRKEAQDLKAKTSPVPASTKPAKAADENQQDSAKSHSKKKGTDGTQEGGKGSKKSDSAKGRDAAVPSVEDASLWPTPQVAIGEEKKKAQEKTDKTDKTEKSPVNRSHGKEKWMPVSYVPSAVFTTPLPSAGRGGGRRPARGGRDGGRGGAHGGAGAGEKTTSGQATPASGGKNAGDRGRNEAGTNRAASLPAQPRRSNSADVNSAEGRKAQGAERNNRGPRTEEAATSNGKQTNGSDNNTRPQRDGKQTNRNNDSRNGKSGHLAVDAQAAARTNDRRFESGSKSTDLNREGGAGGFQDFHRERGDSRPERGGRPNRGRGGPFSGFAGQNAHFGNAGNNFVPKNFNFNDRQRSQHGLANGSQQSNRMPLRSPSLPVSANVYGGYPFPAEINTMYPYQAVNPGPMSAVPFQQYVEPYPLMSMLSMQLEYYFSVDNMCKDMFLRRQMDSQGFVPLNVIASFKRVKSLTEDFELLRHVSRQLRNVEYQTGEDGTDRLRPRESWAQWVLPYEQRDTAAQHDGVRPAQLGKTDENVPFNNHVDAPTNGTLHPASRQFIPNGTPASNSQTLSSAAPEFLPSAQNELSNVGAPKDYSHSPSHKAGPGLASPFYQQNFLEIANIDGSQSARGLDSHKPTPLPSPLVNVAQLNGLDGERKIYRSVHPFARSTDKPPPRNSRLPSEPREKSHYFKRRPASLTNQSNIPRINAPGSPNSNIRTAGGDLFTGFASYQSCFQALMENFNLQMYNDFRRSALDDFLTRHIDTGFNVLMEYYRASVVRPHRRLPEKVLSDMINLCRIDNTKPRVLIFDMVLASMRNHQIDHCNFSRVRGAFNENFGEAFSRPPRHTRY